MSRTPPPAQPAPPAVGVVSPEAPNPVEVPPGSYMVKRGDTLYRVALDNGLDYRELAAWNGLANVNDIKVGQILRLNGPGDAKGVEVKPLVTDSPTDGGTIKPVSPTPSVAPDTPSVYRYPQAVKLPYTPDAAARVAAAAEPPTVASMPQKTVVPTAVPTPVPTAAPGVKTPVKPDVADSSDDKAVDEWLMPTAGQVTKGFTSDSKGIDIPGKMGQPIVASGSGKVVYAGAGLRGYGKMIIIKHNKEYLTAYAHNSKLIVKEGDVVKRGEKIAEMGDSDTDQVKLHFEIRRFGKPVDPAKYIQTEKP
ncbi:LysM peptidoglycan-binding domain-containing protein [Chitiniphilus eburneus]|uniref:LysM peptidoglycan-binding domain-containing protein n=2 Tax=Chitiniphilus eburneus TaxID=2571148 RepID=A0A4U0PYG6_9NEIS|nr:LysM peptidoglycan-binding domain-containing protein [Chitiniphilus eburneus]